MRALRALALAAVAAGCSSTPDEVTDPGSVLREEDGIRFDGNRSFSAGDLRDAIADLLADWRQDGHRKSTIDDAAWTIEGFYRSQGFPFAEVTYDYEPHEPPPPAVTIVVEEGPRCRLADVAFTGNEVFDQEDLVAYLEPERSFLFFEGERLYVASEVEGAVSEIETRYLERGYLDVRVGPPEVAFGDARERAWVTIPIVEGTQYVLRSVEFEGVGEEARSELAELVEDFVGEPWYSRIDYELEAAARAWIMNEGHPQPRVETRVAIDEATGEVSVRVRITSGPRAYVRSIVIEGNEGTHDWVIRNRVKLEKGELWRRQLELETFRALYRSGLFDRVDIEVRPLEGGGEEDWELWIRVVERPSIELYVEPGYGSYELFRLSAGARERNLFGTGFGLRTEGTVAVLAQKGLVGLTIPHVLGTEWDVDFVGFGARREEPSFTRLEVGGGVSFRRRWTEEIETLVGYQFRRSQAEDIDPNDPTLPSDLDKVDISSISFSPIWDDRDDVFLPSRGTRAEVVNEWAAKEIGSEIDFYRVRLGVATFFPLSPTTVLGLNFRTGAIVPMSDTTSIPIQERFFNGGESTVRSFYQDELGPTDAGGEQTGGETFSVASVELRQALIGNLHGAFFVDAGNVSFDASDYWEFDDIRTGVGIGLRYVLPIGPVRLDAALNPDPREGEDDGAIHFSVGMAF